MLPVCASADKPYVIGHPATAGLALTTGRDTPEQACRDFAGTVHVNGVANITSSACFVYGYGQPWPIYPTCREPQEHVFPPFNLDLAEAAQIAGAILIVWGTGYGIRMVIRALRQSDEGIQDGD